MRFASAAPGIAVTNVRGRVPVVMVDQSARAYERIGRMHPKMRLNAEQSAKLDSMIARSFTDDVEVRRGALSAPRTHNRPGQRDDEVHCNFVGMLPMV